MSSLDISHLVDQPLLFISPSGVLLRFSSQQLSLLGNKVTLDSINNCLLHNYFSLIVYHLDAFNLHSVPPDLIGPKYNQVLVLGDTHHGFQPLQRLVDWLKSSSVLRVINYSCPHHDEIISKASSVESIYFPFVFAVRKWKLPIVRPSNAFVKHVGSLSVHHVRRRFLLDNLVSAHASIRHCSVFGDLMIESLNDSICILNVSLNCDIPHRVSEVLAAGSLLLTDRATRYQKYLFELEALGLVCFYDPMDSYTVFNLVNDMSARYGQDKHLQECFSTKILNQGKLINLLRNLSLYNCLAKYLLGFDSRLPDLLTPVSSSLSKQEVVTHLPFYETAMDFHRRNLSNEFFGNNSEFILNSRPIKALLERLSGYNSLFDSLP
uniref:hypothetical protein n=1 Tax=Cyanobium sp. TaxID=2164130 RepID=UPI0040487E2D